MRSGSIRPARRRVLREVAHAIHVELRADLLVGHEALGVRELDQLPANARAYLDRISELTGVPVDIISTGAERNETIILRHPFAAR